MVVCINGEDENNKTEKEVNKFFLDHNEIPSHIIVTKKVGKNNAINRIVEFAKKMDDIEIVHFFDDDVILEKGTLLINIEELIKEENIKSRPLIIGSAFIAVGYSFSFFYRKYSFFRAVLSWIFHNIIIQPYLLEAERPRFCEGPSFGLYLKYFPTLPADEVGITDDAFLSDFFAIKGKADYLQNRMLSIIKPANSISYIKVPSSFKEWKMQQIRIHAGIERAFSYFGSERKFLEEYFSWNYAFNKKSRTNLQTKSLLKIILYSIYMHLHEKNRKYAERFIIKNQLPRWSIAESTKI